MSAPCVHCLWQVPAAAPDAMQVRPEVQVLPGQHWAPCVPQDWQTGIGETPSKVPVVLQKTVEPMQVFGGWSGGWQQSSPAFPQIGAW